MLNKKIIFILYKIFDLQNGLIFLTERWKGEHALLWDKALIQSSLKEMIHCGLFGLELEDNNHYTCKRKNKQQANTG